MIRKLPRAPDGRVETGAVQFGDDWPGLFIRGDDCMTVARSIRRVLRALTAEQAPDVATFVGDLQEIAEVIEKSVLVKR